MPTKITNYKERVYMCTRVLCVFNVNRIEPFNMRNCIFFLLKYHCYQKSYKFLSHIMYLLLKTSSMYYYRDLR